MATGGVDSSPEKPTDRPTRGGNMPEPYTRCARCGTTFAAHGDPDIGHCEAFTLAVDPPPDGELVHVLRVEDAQRLLAEAGAEMGAVVEKLERQVHQLSADLELCMAAHAEAEATNELWGAFDYELLLLAEAAEIDTEGLAPLEVVDRLRSKAYDEGFEDGWKPAEGGAA
jgi:hypothetical protein